MDKKITFALIGAILIYILSGCSTKHEQVSNETKLSGTLSISGAFALYPMAVKWAEEFKKLNPDVKIDISAGGAGKGMTDVLSGMVDIGMLSRDVNKEEETQGAWKIALTKDAYKIARSMKRRGESFSALCLRLGGKSAHIGKHVNLRDLVGILSKPRKESLAILKR